MAQNLQEAIILRTFEVQVELLRLLKFFHRSGPEAWFGVQGSEFLGWGSRV